MKNIVIATIHKWNVAYARELKRRLSGKYRVVIITSPSALSPNLLRRLNPEYVFFPHWSWKIPAEIYARHECVVFHMTDLPFGRGGSPLQNLIGRGLGRTRMTAIRVVEKLDAGPVYMKCPLSLKGSAQEIYERASALVFGKMIPDMLLRHPIPRPQKGLQIFFFRRKPAESRLPSFGTLRQAYDFIRMLDADGYPRAFLEFGELRAEFSSARLERGRLIAEVAFMPKE